MIINKISYYFLSDLMPNENKSDTLTSHFEIIRRTKLYPSIRKNVLESTINYDQSLGPQTLPDNTNLGKYFFN